MKIENNSNGTGDPGYFTKFVLFDETTKIGNVPFIAVNRYEYNRTHIEAVFLDTQAVADGKKLWSVNGSLGGSHGSVAIKPSTAINKLRDCNGAKTKTPWLVIGHHDINKLHELASRFWQAQVQNQIISLLYKDPALRKTGVITTNVAVMSKPSSASPEPAVFDPFEL